MKYLQVRTALVRARIWGARLMARQLRHTAPGRQRARASLIFRRAARLLPGASPRSSFLWSHVHVHYHWHLVFNTSNVTWRGGARSTSTLQYPHTLIAATASPDWHELAPYLRDAALRWRVAAAGAQQSLTSHGTPVSAVIRSSRRHQPRQVHLAQIIAEAAPLQFRTSQGRHAMRPTPCPATWQRLRQQPSLIEAQAAQRVETRHRDYRGFTQTVTRLPRREMQHRVLGGRFAPVEVAPSMVGTPASNAVRVSQRMRRRASGDQLVPLEVAESTNSTPVPNTARVAAAELRTVARSEALRAAGRRAAATGRLAPRVPAERDSLPSPALAAERLVHAASMVWRRTLESAASPSATATVGEIRSGRDRASLASAEASHGHAAALASTAHATAHHLSSHRRGDSTTTSARTVFSGEQVERLTDDVIRRIERRLREDRQRRGR